MDNIILSIINNQTLVDIIQELHPNWSKKIRPYEDLQSFLLSADNNQISNNILIFDIDEKSLTKDDLAKIKIPVICITNNLNEDINFYSLRGLRVEKILKPFKINIFFLKVKLCQSKNKFQEMSFVKISNYQLDTNKREIIRDKRKLKLTEREVDLLIFLKFFGFRLNLPLPFFDLTSFALNFLESKSLAIKFLLNTLIKYNSP